MKKMKVEVKEEYRGNLNPKRKFAIYIDGKVDSFNLLETEVAYFKEKIVAKNPEKYEII